MAVNAYVPTPNQGSIVLSDGTGTPVTLTLPYTRGDLQISGLPGGAFLNETVDIEARGQHICTAYGARRYPSITFTAWFAGEAGSAPASIQAFLTKNTPYTANVSTFGSGSQRVYAVDLTVNIEMSNFGGSDWSTTFNDCVCTEWSFSEGAEGATVSFTVSVKGAITGDLDLAQFS